MRAENLEDCVRNSEVQLNAVREVLRNGNAAEARRLFSLISEAETIEYLLVKGELELKFQQWGKAYNAFLKILQLQPGHAGAKAQLAIIDGILSFRNNDMLNP